MPDKSVLAGERDESLADELLRRLEIYAAADHESQARDREKEIHDALTAQAQRHNLPLPPPLRPCPHDEESLRRIAAEGLEDVLGIPPSVG